jgi:dTDP-glucose 4,6-dehydratase
MRYERRVTPRRAACAGGWNVRTREDAVVQSILITGGAGFIGSNFTRFLMTARPNVKVHVLDALTYAGNLDNFPDWVLDNVNFKFWYGNVCNPDIVNAVMEQVDTVIHFAAESHVARSIFDNTVFFQTDVLGTQTIANHVLKHRRRVRRFVHISTSEVYGTALTEPMDEKHALNPLSPYASAKCGADRLVYSYWATYAIPSVIVRPFNQFGPHQHLEKCIPRFITNALCGEPLTVHGDGSAARDWVFVDDTCHALLAAIEAPLDEVIGAGDQPGDGPRGQCRDDCRDGHRYPRRGSPADRKRAGSAGAGAQAHQFDGSGGAAAEMAGDDGLRHGAGADGRLVPRASGMVEPAGAAQERGADAGRWDARDALRRGGQRCPALRTRQAGTPDATEDVGQRRRVR